MTSTGPKTARARGALRWAVWTAGTLFTVLVEAYWYLDEILPPPVGPLS